MPQGRSVCSLWITEAVIKERLQTQNETNKRRSKMKQKQNTRPSSKTLSRRGHWVLLLKTTANILRFVFVGNSLRNKNNWAATGFGDELGKPFWVALETVAEKIRLPCSHAKKIRIRILRFRKIHSRERFRKASFWGPSTFKNLRIRADTCDHFYASGVEELRFRKDPCTCARSLS